MTEATAAPAEPKVTISSVACTAIRDGATNEEALEAVKRVFPEAKTTLPSINWYRNKLRSEDKSIKTSRELKKAKNPPAPAADAALDA